MAKEKKITTKVVNETTVDVVDKQVTRVDEDGIELKRVYFDAVKSLEDRAKVGFFCERKDDPKFLERQFRLCCESKDGESDPSVLTPWCTANTLQTMIDGCLYLHPLIIATIKDRQANAPKPEE